MLLLFIADIVGGVVVFVAVVLVLLVVDVLVEEAIVVVCGGSGSLSQQSLSKKYSMDLIQGIYVLTAQSPSVIDTTGC